LLTLKANASLLLIAIVESSFYSKLLDSGAENSSIWDLPGASEANKLAQATNMSDVKTKNKKW
jgi:hypothetical protein